MQPRPDTAAANNAFPNSALFPITGSSADVQPRAEQGAASGGSLFPIAQHPEAHASGHAPPAGMLTWLSVKQTVQS